MARSIDKIIADLNDYVPSYDWLILGELTREVLETGEAEKAVDAMFSIIEKYPDEDLGNPGPLVHTLEKCQGYESHLIASVQRQPTRYNVMMVNRILNDDISLNYRKSLLALLACVLNHPRADESAKESALNFIEWQSGRGEA